MNRFPQASHDFLKSNVPNLPGTKYVCMVRYGNESHKQLHSTQAMTHFKNLPQNAISIRENILMRNKDLAYGSPRPDFSNNKFCLSCHIPQSSRSYKEMDTRALIKNAEVKAEDDDRRQPMQPARLFRGVIPVNYFGPGRPSSTITNPTDEQQKIDRWILSN